jgi:hypothetical protein
MAFLKKVNVPAGAGKTAYAGEEMEQGLWVELSGEFSAVQINNLPSGQKNKPGYASVGDKRVIKATGSGDTGRVYPVKKIIVEPEDSDSDSDYTTIDAGQSLTYFTEGTFETDQYTDVSGTGAAFGDYLKLSSSKLVEEAAATTETANSVARVIKINNSGDSTKDSLEFEMIT